MKTFIRYFGYILLISALFWLVPLTAVWIYHESVFLFLVGFLLSAVLGAGLLWLERKVNLPDSSLDLTSALMLVALSFIVLSLIGSISFLPSFNYNLLDALFESFSGFTTTGLTLYSSLAGLPKSLLLWRAETQWMGGIGIIMVFIFIASRLKFHSGHVDSESDIQAGLLYQAQGFPQKLEPSLKKTSANIFLIYGCYTLLGIILLTLAGMPFFNSLAMTFTSLSTGGFVVEESFYSNNFQLIVLCLLMILGSISFLTHNYLLNRKFKEFLCSFEKNLFLFLIVGAVLITLIAYTDMKVIIFELISAFTTTGYSLTKLSLLPHLFLMMVFIGMFIGGGIASTAGGVKISRIYILIKMIPWMIKKLTSPVHAIIPFKVKGKQVEEENLLIVSIFVSCYFLILVLGTIIFLILGYNLFDSSFQITSALGTVGLQTLDLITVPWLGKIFLILAMLLGRLEIFPLLVLAKQLFRK